MKARVAASLSSNGTPSAASAISAEAPPEINRTRCSDAPTALARRSAAPAAARLDASGKGWLAAMKSRPAGMPDTGCVPIATADRTGTAAMNAVAMAGAALPAATR